MQEAGYRQATHLERFHPSFLLDPSGDRRKAEQAYRNLLNEAPDDERVLTGLSYLLQLAGRGDEAGQYRHRIWCNHARALGLSSSAQRDAAEFLCSAETGRPSPPQPPAAYIEGLFDWYAADFERHLVDALGYRAPEVLYRLYSARFPDLPGALDLLDIGCGTGLAGAVFRPLAARLDGIDLSQKMLEEARRKQVYDRLIHGEIVEELRRCHERYHLVVAADVLVYFGDLTPLFEGVAAVLRSAGCVAFVVEKGTTPGYRLRSSGRYQHAIEFVQCCGDASGLRCLCSEEVSYRTQYGEPVIGCAVVMQKQS